MQPGQVISGRWSAAGPASSLGTPVAAPQTGVSRHSARSSCNSERSTACTVPSSCSTPVYPGGVGMLTACPFFLLAADGISLAGSDTQVKRDPGFISPESPRPGTGLLGDNADLCSILVTDVELGAGRHVIILTDLPAVVLAEHIADLEILAGGPGFPYSLRAGVVPAIRGDEGQVHDLFPFLGDSLLLVST